MVRPTIQKIEQVRTVGGYNKGFWTLVLTLVFATVCLIHIETSRGKPLTETEIPKITVERLPSSEARRLGVDPRNN